jgi:hypothetical protein
VSNKMGGGDALQGKAYTRYLSNNIRKWSPKQGARFIEEDPIIGGVSGLARCVMLTVCRNRQRLLQQAWITWTKTVDVQHDYTADVRTILSHPLKETQMRTEFEIEIMFKWVRQHATDDVTGIAHNIFSCTSKKVICQCLQHMRLESFQPGDPVLYQGALPKEEDGHFTILAGSCDVVQFPVDSISFIKLQQYSKKCHFEGCRKVLMDCTVLATMDARAGFGELSTLTGVKRAVTIRASLANKELTDILVLPKTPFMDCLENRRGTMDNEDSAPSEAIELFRQTGLAARINPQELVSAAASMKKIYLSAGEVLYRKGEPANRLFLVVSGDFALDTMDLPVKPSKGKGKGKGKVMYDEAFVSSNEEHVFHLSGGSILGDEGILGLDNAFVATAAVASDYAVVFEAVGFARKFLFDRVKAMRYAALVYKELPRWTIPIPEAESNNLYGCLNSLRKVVSVCRPSRGVVKNWHVREEDLQAEPFQEMAPLIREIKKKKAIEARNNSKKDGGTADGDKEKEIAMALKRKKEEAQRKKANKAKAADRKMKGITGKTVGSGSGKGTEEYRDAAGNMLERSGTGFIRLSLTALNAARGLNAASKKLQNESVQIHARNNLLQDQLLREAADDSKEILDDDEVSLSVGKGQPVVMGHSGPLQGHWSSDAVMIRTARKHQISEATAKFNDALTMYHERQEKYVEEKKEEVEEVLRVGEAANMVSMFKQAAAGAMGDADADADGSDLVATGTDGDNATAEDFEAVDGTHIEGLHETHHTEQERMEIVLELLARPKTLQYLQHLLRAEASNAKKEEVERIDMDATFAAATEAETATASGSGESEADALLAFKKDLKNLQETTAIAGVAAAGFEEAESGDGEGEGLSPDDLRLLGREWDKTGMPVPEMINKTNWRPPSASGKGSESHTGGLVPLISPTHSRPTTRDVEDKRPSSPWKEKEFKYSGLHHAEEEAAAGLADTQHQQHPQHQDGEANLSSLQFDEEHYKTHAARMKLVASSGYGQEHIEAAAKEALGMTLKEFKDISAFTRMAAPQGMRRIVLPPALVKMNKLGDDGNNKKKQGENEFDDVLHALMRRTGHIHGLEENFSDWSIDMESPEGFLSQLHKKDFEKRKEFLVRNGWNTRAMRVTDNSRPVVEVSLWLQRELELFQEREKKQEAAAAAAADPSGIHSSPRKQRAVARERKKREEEEKAMWASLELGAQSANLIDAPEHGSEEGDHESAGDEEHDDFSQGGVKEGAGIVHDLNSMPAGMTKLGGGGGVGVVGAGGTGEEKSGETSHNDSGANTPPHELDSARGLKKLEGSFISATSAASSSNDVLESARGDGGIKRRGKKGTRAEEAPAYHEAKLPSQAIKHYQETTANEYSSRKFLEGKRKNSQTSRFKLAPVELSPGKAAPGPPGGEWSMDSSLELLKHSEIRASKGKDKALMSSLVPEHVSMMQALDKIRREKEKRDAVQMKKNKVMAARLEQHSVTSSGGGSSKSLTDLAHKVLLTRPEHASEILSNDGFDQVRHDIESWQHFSVGEAVRAKNGPHMTLPVLCLAGSDPLLKPPKKSSLKYGGGNMARVDGQDEMSFAPVSSYLDVFTRSFRNGKL